MVIGRLMHILRELVYCISNIRACKGQIMEATNNGVILRRIKEHYYRVKCKCRSSDKECNNRLGIIHACSSKEVIYVCALRQKQALRIRNYFNYEKVS